MKNKTDYGKKLTKKLIFKIIYSTVIYTFLFILTWIFLRIICGFITWYPNNVLYRILTNIGYDVVNLVFLWLIGFIILVVIVLRKTLSYIDSIVEESQKLTSSSEEFINLPEDLKEVETRMNQIKQVSIYNARLAKENEQRKNDLIVYLAHDIKTPLTSMVGYLSLLDEVKDMPKKQKEKYTKVALEKSYKLEDLINELFDIARFNSETIVLEKEELNLNMMIEQIIDDFYPTLKELDKEIVVEKNQKVTLYGDSDKLGRVFNNVIKNAINYSSSNSKIIVEITKAEGFASIVISNKGKKIPEEKLNRIFEKFYRADTSRTTKTGGSGLGLAIAKDIVELHGGEIYATSDEEFTKFYINLPII